MPDSYGTSTTTPPVDPRGGFKHHPDFDMLTEGQQLPAKTDPAEADKVHGD